MAKVNLRSISTLATTPQGSKEGKRFSFLDFFPFSKDTTHAIFIASLPILPVFTRTNQARWSIQLSKKPRRWATRNRKPLDQLQDHQNGNPQNDMEGMSQTFSVLQRRRGECLVNKSRNFFKHKMEASFLTQEDKELLNELHTTGHWSAGTPIFITCDPHIFRAFVLRAKIQSLWLFIFLFLIEERPTRTRGLEQPVGLEGANLMDQQVDIRHVSEALYAFEFKLRNIWSTAAGLVSVRSCSRICAGTGLPICN
jgi:hypothetical protein